MDSSSPANHPSGAVPQSNVANLPSQHPPSTSPNQTSPASPASPISPTFRRPRGSTNASATSATSRIRSASIKLMEASPPPGMWAATGTVAARAPSVREIRTGSFGTSGWNEERQRLERRRSGSDGVGKRATPRKGTLPVSGGSELGGDPVARPSLGKETRVPSSTTSSPAGLEPFPALTEVDTSIPAEALPHHEAGVKEQDKSGKTSTETAEKVGEAMTHAPEVRESQYANGYLPPPKLPWKTSTVIALKAFWKWFLTPAGFLITLYGLNVVAWGGMLFLLLCNAAPAMCHPSCDHIQSPRRIWIEIDSQILNALFNVTGFGLAPWRFRDVYWWTLWRLGGKQERKEKGLRRLAGIHRGWFRLPGSDGLEETATASTLNPNNAAVPIPLSKVPDPPPTGIRAPPTKGWKLDFVVWMNMWNTFFQVVLCYFMYNYNRYNRPSWATGTFVALGCIVAGLGGIMMYLEGKAVKKVEGVPMPKKGEGTKDVEAGQPEVLLSNNGEVKR